MPKSPEKLGELIQSRLFQMRKRSDRFFKELEIDLKRLNKMTTRVTNKLYDQVLSSLETLQGTSMPINTIGNLSQVSTLMQGLDTIQNDYRHAYGQLIRNARLDMLEIVITREAALEKVLRDEEGIIEDRTIVSDQAFEMMDVGYQKTLQRMNVILDNWKSFAYDTFYSGLIKGVPISLFKSWFFNDDGTLKIGSSLDVESTYTAVQSIVEQRTTYLRGKAQENGWKYCWNSNPMDPLTKSECIDATIAGVISEAEMGSGYGFPPRYICRCEVVYTRPEWVRVNKGVNSSIEKSRLSLVQQLINAPRQKGKWTRGGKTVKAKDITRAQGNLMYKEVEDKLGLLADRGPVPDFDFDDFGLIGGVPPVLPPTSSVTVKFVPAKTIKEGQEYLKRVTGISTSYEGIEDVKIINMINKEIINIYQKTKGLKTITSTGEKINVIEKIIVGDFPLGEIAEFRNLNRTIKLNKNIFKDVKSYKKFGARFKESMVNANPVGIIDHEVAHALINSDKVLYNIKNSIYKKYGENIVSKYSTFNADEMIAEAFVYYLDYGKLFGELVELEPIFKRILTKGVSLQ